MALVDRVKFDSPSNDVLVWKYPSEELKIGSQVIVNQSQEAVFVKGGQALDVLGPGTHTLNTGNIPLINKIINAPFGGSTPFTAEIWYINKTVKRDLKWGTPSPIQVMDPSLGFPISVRSFGQWGIRVENSRSFTAQIVGSKLGADAAEVEKYFIGEIRQKLANALASAISTNRISLFEISASTNQLSERLASDVREEFARFGVELVNLNIESINIPTEEMKKIQEVFAKKMEAEQLSRVNVGQGYAAIKTFETLKSAAENESAGGGVVAGMLGAGIGLGAGFPLGQQLGQQMTVAPSSKATPAKDDVEARLSKLKDLFDRGLISKEKFESKQSEILADL